MNLETPIVFAVEGIKIVAVEIQKSHLPSERSTSLFYPPTSSHFALD